MDDADWLEVDELLGRLVAACECGELVASPVEVAALVGAMVVVDRCSVQQTTV